MLGEISSDRVHELHELMVGAVGFVDDRGLAGALFGKTGGAGIRNPDLHRPQPLRPEDRPAPLYALRTGGCRGHGELPLGSLRYM